eukprot:gnl/Dysnectes_brevis/10369_a20457_191.p1 GENE.gnl/Dysnectes_brevis/10369_a20457_191~~gnl/Dysnectes_brevis/10369_a20457_191.p1  ORF type:complete len:256 (-),score=-16.49 gnl/Dysnectes_brevis/10369_a20457_191:16-783(-)
MKKKKDFGGFISLREEETTENLDKLMPFSRCESYILPLKAIKRCFDQSPLSKHKIKPLDFEMMTAFDLALKTKKLQHFVFSEDPRCSSQDDFFSKHQIPLSKDPHLDSFLFSMLRCWYQFNDMVTSLRESAVSHIEEYERKIQDETAEGLLHAQEADISISKAVRSFNAMQDCAKRSYDIAFHSGRKKQILTSQARKRTRTFPSSAKAILMEWFEAHRDHPYPTPGEKHQLSLHAGISVDQVSNWYGNQRQRAKK